MIFINKINNFVTKLTKKLIINFWYLLVSISEQNEHSLRDEISNRGLEGFVFDYQLLPL